MSVVLTRDEKAQFDQFYRIECLDGSRLFWMPDPSTDGWHLLASDHSALLTVDGQPLLLGSQWLCAWGDELPTETVVDQVKFRKSFQVVVMP